jgi:hypothetical protein
MIKLAKEREVAPYVWVHPEDDDRRSATPDERDSVSVVPFVLPVQCSSGEVPLS